MPARLAAAFALCGAASALYIPAASPAVKWIGRSVADNATGSVSFDWEGVAASVSLTGVSYVIVNISDDCGGTGVGGGSRWLVTMTTSNANTAEPNHRISTFYSGPLVSSYYLFNNPGQRCDPDCDFSGSTTFTLTRLTESRLSGCAPGAGLAVNGFQTDGAVAPPPPPSPRRLEFVGDSITAGDLNDGGSGIGAPSICGNAAFNDDITLSTGGQLCLPEALGGFGADCMFTAWGGITLGPMAGLYPHTFSADLSNAYGTWAFAPPAPGGDAIVINLGTNDHPAPPALAWQAEYVSFVHDIVYSYRANPSLEVFIAYGPMTVEYEPFVFNISATLVARGIHAHALNLTLPHPMTGCYGHPSAADHVELAAVARPQIAAVMGW